MISLSVEQHRLPTEYMHISTALQHHHFTLLNVVLII